MKKPNTTNTGNNTTRGKQEYLDRFEFSVSGCKVWDNGRVSFNLRINGITIYGCRVVEGKGGDFISFPARKGSDGKYYHYAYAPISPEDEREILKAVEAAINDHA